MRWSCPHCGTQLALPEDRLGTGWSFSRCYKCGGFALIRRSELSIIKVDKAPAGEAVLLPEATEDPRQNLSAHALENYANAVTARAQAQNASTVVASQPRQAPGPATARAIPTIPEIRPAGLRSSTPPASTSRTPQMGALPEPLPELSVSATLLGPSGARLASNSGSRLASRALIGAIVATGLVTLGSGYYLFSEGKQLIRKARTATALPIHRTVAQAAPMSKVPAPDDIAQDVIRLPAGASTLIAPGQAGPAATPPSMIAAPNLNAPNPLAVAAAPLARAAPVSVPAIAVAATSETAGPEPLRVKLRRQGVHLYTGPGTEYPIVGFADPEVFYPVTDWNDRWFKLNLDEAARQAIAEYNRKLNPRRAAARAHPGMGLLIGTTAWVRNDLVRVTSGTSP